MLVSSRKPVRRPLLVRAFHRYFRSRVGNSLRQALPERSESLQDVDHAPYGVKFGKRSSSVSNRMPRLRPRHRRSGNPELLCFPGQSIPVNALNPSQLGVTLTNMLVTGIQGRPFLARFRKRPIRRTCRHAPALKPCPLSFREFLSFRLFLLPVK